MNNFSVNRSKLKNILEDNQMAVVFSGNPVQKLGDEYFPFTPNRNFYYLTGLDRPKMIYFVYKFNGDIEEYIAIERYDEIKAKWVGAVMLPDEVRQISDIQQVIYLDEFEENISSIIFNKRIQKLYLDLENRDFYANTPAINFANEIKNKYNYVTIENLFNIMADFRMVKEAWEVENIVKAIDGTEIPLVVIGQKTKYFKKVEKYLAKNKIEKQVQFLENVSMEELAAIYNLAEIFVYPSLFEGFGIPVIESLFSRTPVITSNISCLPEAGGEHSMYVNPENFEDIKSKILFLWNNESERNRRTEKGLKFVQNFNDEDIAENLMRVYKEI